MNSSTSAVHYFRFKSKLEHCFHQSSASRIKVNTKYSPKWRLVSLFKFSFGFVNFTTWKMISLLKLQREKVLNRNLIVILSCSGRQCSIVRLKESLYNYFFWLFHYRANSFVSILMQAVTSLAPTLVSLHWTNIFYIWLQTRLTRSSRFRKC